MSGAEARPAVAAAAVDDGGPDPERGLSAAQVAARVEAGLVNAEPPGTSRSTSQIVFANVFNPVNAIMFSLFVLILIAGFPADGLFVGVVVSNSVIGIVQELYARRELHRLELLNAPIATVLRDGERVEITVEDIVVDDLVVLAPGEQIVVDAEVVRAEGLEADESLLTGEADPIDKAPGDEVLSGSFVSAGSGLCRATHVGAASYANSLAAEAKRFELVNSELRRGINVILRALVFLIPPTCLLLLLSLLEVEDRWQEALQGTVAAAVAMVPDGLVLLTSLTFVAGVIALARRQALAKELATVELLARVDTLCLDKTGTITTGEISYGSTVPLGRHREAEVSDVLAALAASDPNPNATMAAVASAHETAVDWKVVATEPFSSARKWSATEFAGRGTFFFGAPDILLDEDDVAARAAGDPRVRARTPCPARHPLRCALDRRPAGRARSGRARVARRHRAPRRPRDPGVLRRTGRHPQGHLRRQRRHGGCGRGQSRHSQRRCEHRCPGAARRPRRRSRTRSTVTTVFGRVTPHQKRAMVGALQAKGRVVAMTGDGVNDVLALKDADMGIAMGSGSSASRGVAQLVLLDNRFATLPEVLAQGRHVINNIERVSNLFVTKAVYAVLLTAIIGIQQVEFPFLPRQLTLIGTFSIGLPGLFLALAPNVNLVRPGFLQRVLRFSIPAGIVAGIATWSVYQYARDGAAAGQISDAQLADARSAATITLLGIGLVVLVVVSRPLRLWKIGLAASMAAMYVLVLAWDLPRDYFELTIPPANVWFASGGAVAAAGATIIAIPLVVPGLRLAERIAPAS